MHSWFQFAIMKRLRRRFILRWDEEIGVLALAWVHGFGMISLLRIECLVAMWYGAVPGGLRPSSLLFYTRIVRSALTMRRGGACLEPCDSSRGIRQRGQSF